MSKKINVLSLFDGISCMMEALNKSNIKVNKYYASEIDKHATKVSHDNFPSIIRLGDITKWKQWNINWKKIDIVAAGSPCQGFSFAGKQLAFDDPRSVLFFTFVDILRYIRRFNPNVKFLLENVKMKAEYSNVITSILQVNPITINSSLVSAQNRVRMYWANWNITQPEDKGIVLKDILQPEEEIEEKYYIPKIPEGFDGLDINKKARTLRVGGSRSMDNKHNYDIIKINKKGNIKKHQNKASCLTGGGNSGGNHSDMDIICVAQRGRLIINGKRQDHKMKTAGLTTQRLEPRKDQKTNCLTTVQKDNLILNKTKEYSLRRLTPIECERLQGLPDNYTKATSNTQRYKALGNAWNIPTITHILKTSNLNK